MVQVICQQGAISKRNGVSFPDHGRIVMTKNFLIYPSLALVPEAKCVKYGVHHCGSS